MKIFELEATELNIYLENEFLRVKFALGFRIFMAEAAVSR